MFVRRAFMPAFVIFLLPVIWVVLSAPAEGQGKNDAFFGYSRTGSDLFYPNTPGLNGWEADAQIHWKTFLGVEGDLAHYGLGANDTVPRSNTFLVGPRVTVGAAGFKVFGHFLLGGEHSANNVPAGTSPSISGGAFAYALGAGVDVPLVPFLAWRFQGDRLSAPSQSTGGGTHARFTTGLVLRF